MYSRVMLVAFSVLMGLIAFSVPASATFPGKNGRIAFIQGADIFTMNADGSDVRQLTSYTDDNPASEESWSPNGKQLAFSRFFAPDFFGQLWLMNSDGSNQHILLNDPGFDDEFPGFSPDGDHIIFNRCTVFHGEFPCAIYRVQLDGSGLREITPLRIERGDLWPVYSPDGSKISFTSFGRNGILGALYVMDADGSNIHMITPAITGAFLSDWSPDGRSIAFADHCCIPLLVSLFTIRPDGTNPRRTTQDHNTFNDLWPSWSPDGNTIVFERTNVIDGSSGIWVVHLDGSEAMSVHSIPAGAVRQHSFALQRTQIGKRNRPRPKELEDGGTYPRWGVAQ